MAVGYPSRIRAWIGDWAGGLIVALFVSSLGYVAWQIFAWGHDDHRTTIGDLAFVAIAAVVALLGLRAASSSALDPPTRRAWRYIALGYLAYGLGNVVWAWYELVLHRSPFPSLADPLYLMLAPLILVGMLIYPAAPRGPARQTAFWLDVSIALVGGFMVIWYVVLGPTATAGGDSPLATVLATAYPVSDVVLLFAVAATLPRRPGLSSRNPLSLLVVGVLLLLIGDVGFGYLSLSDRYVPGNWPDSVWLGAYLFMAWAAQRQVILAQPGRRVVSDDLVRPRAVIPDLAPNLYLQYVAMVVGFGLLVGVALRHTPASVAGLIVFAVLLTCLVVARQVITMRENARLLDRARRLAVDLEHSESRLSALVSHTSDIIAILAPDGTVLYESPTVERVLGYTPDEIRGTNAFDLIHHDDLAAVVEGLARSLSHPGIDRPQDLRARHRDGSWRYLEVISNNLMDDPAVHGIVITLRDVSERKALEEQLRHQALHDPLTGLANRTLFVDRAEQARARAGRSGARMALLFIDLDGFKEINDGLGHDVGDDALRAVADRLGTALRSGDAAVRLGGDEFAVLMEDIGDSAQLLPIVERLHVSLSSPYDIDQQRVLVPMSIGVAVSPPGGAAPEELLRHADIAMYRAKARGRARVEVFTPALDADTDRRLSLTADLGGAPERGEILVRYRPIVELSGGTVVEVEALPYWQHPRLGLLRPEQFLPGPDETGSSLPVGHWLLRKATGQLRRWRDAGAMDLDLRLRLSPRQLQDLGLVAAVRDALAAADLPPSCLTLAVDEPPAQRERRAALDVISALRDVGCRIALDGICADLGAAGCFPADGLTIVLPPAGSDAANRTVAGGIMAFARVLDLPVTAQEVDCPEQLQHARTLGCTRAEGAAVAPALAPDGFAAFLVQHLRVPIPV